jgi:arabinofuranan 3-O-arabinosyltransferase
VGVTFDGDGTASSISIDQPGGDTSPVTALTLTDAAGSFSIAVPLPATDGPSTVDLALPRPVSLSGLHIRIDDVENRTTVDRRFGEPVTLPAAISEIRFDGRSPAVRPSPTVSADCRMDLLQLDGDAVGVSFTVDTDTLLAGDALDVELCDPPTRLAPGEHELVSANGAGSGLQVDRVTIRESGAATRSETIVADVVSSSSRQRVVEVPACPDGCWIVLGEGFNIAWQATADGQGLGEPELVDGNANGWYLEPSGGSRTVTMTWTAQRPVAIALGVSLIAVLALITIVIVDRRRRDGTADAAGAVASPLLTPAGDTWGRAAGAATVVGTVAASALLIGWGWALLATLALVPAIALRRARIAGWIGLVIVVGAAGIVTAIVRSERPYPNAGWPVRFEWLHGWTLLGVLLVTCATLFADDARRPPS